MRDSGRLFVCSKDKRCATSAQIGFRVQGLGFRVYLHPKRIEYNGLLGYVGGAGALGNYSTYFWGPGRDPPSKHEDQ